MAQAYLRWFRHLRMTDVDSRTIQKVALALQQGGVGYYRRADFVHLDTGRIRSW